MLTATRRNITFDPIPHTYTDESGSLYTSVTTLIGQVSKEFKRHYWLIYKALERVDGMFVFPADVDKGIIGMRFQGQEVKCHYKDVRKYFIGRLPSSISDIAKEWEVKKDEACTWGTNKHNYFEDCVNDFYGGDRNKIKTFTKVKHVSDIVTEGFSIKIENEAQLEQSPLSKSHPTIYQKFLSAIRNGWTIYAEKIVYSADVLVSGLIDIVMVKGMMAFLLDWKTNKKHILFSAGYYKKRWNSDRTRKIVTDQWIHKDETFLYPLNYIPYCLGEKYTLQLSTYALLCEIWGFKIQGIMLCHIQPHLDKYGEPLMRNGRRVEQAPNFMKLQYRKNDIKKLFQWRMQNMN